MGRTSYATRLLKQARADKDIWDEEAEQRIDDSSNLIKLNNIQQYGHETPTTEDITGVPLQTDIEEGSLAPTYDKFASYLEEVNNVRNNANPFSYITQLGKSAADAVNYFDPNGNKALLTEEQKVNYANENLKDLSEDDLNKLRQFNEEQDNSDSNIFNELAYLNSSGNAGSDNAMQMSNARKAQDEIKKELQDRLGIDDETFKKYVSSARYLTNLEERKKEQEELANASEGELAAINAGKVLLSPIRSFTNLAGTLNEYSNPYRDENFDIDHNATGFELGNISNDTSSETSNRISQSLGADDEDASIGSKVANFGAQALYQGATSGIESLIRLATMGTVGTIAEAGLEAYDNAREEAQERGLTKAQAIGTATSQGVAEAIMEVLPVDNLAKMFKSGSAKGIKGAIKEVAKQGAFEGLEEVETDLSNILSDAAINKDKSEFNTKVQDLVSNGMSEDDAFKQVLRDTSVDMAQSFLGGAIGGLGGGTVAIGGSVVNNKYNKEMLDGNYTTIADSISDNVEDYNSEEDYNKAQEVKQQAEKLAEKPKVTSEDRENLIEGIQEVESMGTNLVDTINENIFNRENFANVDGFKIQKNNLSADEVAESMASASQTGDVNAFVEAYRDSQASQDEEAVKIGQDYFNTLSGKFDSFDSGSSALQDAMALPSAEELYDMAVNEDFNIYDYMVNTPKKQAYVEQGMEEARQRFFAQREQEKAAVDEKANAEKTTLDKKTVESIKNIDNLENVEQNDNGDFVITNEGNEDVVVPKFSKVSGQSVFMTNAVNQPGELRQAYVEGYNEQVPVGTYNNIIRKTTDAGRVGNKANPISFNEWYDNNNSDVIKNVNRDVLEEFYNFGFNERNKDNRNAKQTSAVKGEGKFGSIDDKGNIVGVDKSLENSPIVTVAKQFVKRHGTSVGIKVGDLVGDVEVNKTDDKGDVVKDINGSIVTETQTLTYNGEFSPKLNKVLLGINGKELQTLLHEGFGERLQAYCGKEISELYDNMAVYLQNTMGVDEFENEINRRIEAYKEAGKDADYSYALYEFLNDSLIGLFTSDKGQQDFVDNLTKKENKSLKDKFVELFNRLLQNFKQLVADLKASGNMSAGAVKIAEASEEQLQEWRDKLFELMDLADERTGQAEGKTETQDKNYSLNDKYEGKQRYVDNLMSKNAEVETLSEEEHEVLRQLAKYRHELHTSWDDIFDSETDDILDDFMEFVEENNLPINFNYDDLITDIDYYELLDNEEKEEYEKQAEEFNKENPNSVFPMTAYQMWKEDGNYDEFASQMENLNKQIEDYLASVDAEHGTHYAPTGKARMRNFSLTTDSQGRELTKGQKEYFKDSKVRDDRGRLKVMYHGTEQPGFTVFGGRKNWFTDFRDIASSYAGSSNEIILDNVKSLNVLNDRLDNTNYNVVKKDGKYVISESDFYNDTKDVGSYKTIPETVNRLNDLLSEEEEGKVYSVYLNVTNPLTIDVKGNDFENIEYNGKTYNTTDISEYARDNGYDGLILKNINDPGFASEYVEQDSESDIVVAFNSNQIKSVDNTNPTADNDIRYSFDVSTRYDMGLEGGIEEADDYAETKKAKAKFTDVLQQTIKSLNYKPTDAQIELIADSLIKEYNSAIDRQWTINNLKGIFNAMRTTDNYDDLTSALMNLCEEVVNQSQEVDKQAEKNYKDFIKSIPKFSLSEEQKREYKGRGLTWNNIFGVLGRFYSKNGANLDSVYADICESARAHNIELDPMVADAEQPLKLIEALEANKPISTKVFEQGADTTDASLYTAIDVMTKYLDNAFADRADNTAVKNAKAELKKQQREYKKAVQQEIKAGKRDIARNAVTKYVERQDRSKHIKSIKKSAKEIYRRIDKPTKTKFVPDILKQPLIEALNALDFLNYKKNTNTPWQRNKNNIMWRDRFISLKDLLEKLATVGKTGDKDNYFANDEQRNAMLNLSTEMSDDIYNFFNDFWDGTKGEQVPVSRLSVEQLNALDKFMKSLITSINNAQTLHSNSMFENVSDLAEQSINEIGKNKKVKMSSGASDFMNLRMAEPVTYFEMIGDAAKTLYNEFRKGSELELQRIKEASDDFTKAKEDLKLDNKDVSKWSDDVKTFNVADGTLQLNVPQIMYLYTLWGRDQAKQHIVFGGVTPTELKFELQNKRKHKGYERQTKATHLKPSEVKSITDLLTDKQRALADYMVEYLSTTCSEWGNNVSRKLYGFDMYTETHYMPIITNSDYRRTGAQDASTEAVNVWSTQNKSFSKELVKNANNPIMLEDIFKVFTDHVADMAQYEGFVLPIKDAMKFYDFEITEAELTDIEGFIGNKSRRLSVKEQINEKLGEAGKNYFLTFIKDMNRARQSQDELKGLSKFLSRNKAQAVLANSRVIAQQPTAYLRAGEVISYKYLAKASSLNPLALKKFSELSKEKSSLAWYKSKGYFETYIGQDLQEIITGKSSLKDRINDAMGYFAGLADDLTWGMLYRASMYKFEDSKAFKEGNFKKDKDGKYNDEYYEAVNEIFHEIIVKTQVVDMTLTKSQVMRSQDTGNKLMTAFGAEPTKSYNLLLRGAFDLRQGKGGKKLRKAIGVYVFTNLIVSAVTSVMDAWRDDEEDKPFMERFLNAWLGIENYGEADKPWEYVKAFFGSNIVEQLAPWNLIPVVKEVSNAIQGYDNSNMSTAVLYKAFDVMEHWSDPDSKLTWYGHAYESAQLLSMVTGVPIASAMREVKDVYNNTVNILNLDMPLAKKRDDGGVYDNMLKAIDEDGDVKEEIAKRKEELVNHYLEDGKTQEEAEKKATSTIQSKITSTYKQQLIDLHSSDINAANELRSKLIDAYAYAGVDRNQASKNINKWVQKK